MLSGCASANATNLLLCLASVNVKKTSSEQAHGFSYPDSENEADI